MRSRPYGVIRRYRLSRARLLQFHEHHVGGRVPDVLAVMLLRRQPTHGARVHLDFSLSVTGHEPSPKRRQRVHQAVRVLMGRRAVAWLIGVLEDADPLVLKDDLVVVRVANGGIEAHLRRMTSLE